MDNAEAGIWVWVGKKASHKERTEAMRNAQVCTPAAEFHFVWPGGAAVDKLGVLLFKLSHYLYMNPGIYKEERLSALHSSGTCH